MMNRRWMTLVLGMILVVVLASCGDDGESRDTPAGACTSYAERLCQADEKCSPSFGNFWNDRATCYEREKLGCISQLTASGVNDTPSRVAACADALASFSCDAYLDNDRWPETCTPPPGQLPDGAGCIAWGQCQGGMCWITSRQACGVCKTVARIGGTCSSENDCFNFMPCVNGVCAAHPRRGEACNDEARICVQGSACRDIDAATGVGTCQAPLPADSSCDPGDDDCDSFNGYYCDQLARTCERNPPAPKIGESCAGDLVCGFIASCNDRLVCQANAKEGEACSPDIGCVYPAKCLENVCKFRDPAVCK